MGIRLAVVVLLGMVGALIAIDLNDDARSTLQFAVAFLVLIFIQGGLLQMMFRLSTGETPAYISSCSSCAMAMFGGGMLTLVLTVLLMSVLGDKAAGLPASTLLINSFIASTLVYWVLATPRFCSLRRLGVSPRPLARPVIGVVMSTFQQMLYLIVWLVLGATEAA